MGISGGISKLAELNSGQVLRANVKSTLNIIKYICWNLHFGVHIKVDI